MLTKTMVFCFLIIILFVSGRLYGKSLTGNETPDEALSENYKKPTIAVVEFKGHGLSNMELAEVSELVRNSLVKTKLFNVTDRRNMEMIILEKQKF